MDEEVLVLSPKKTVKSMGLLYFEPSGAFCFEKNRWVKIYEVTGDINKAALAALKTRSRVRITQKITEENDQRIYITLLSEASSYEEVKKIWGADEMILSEMIRVKPLKVNEAIEAVMRLPLGEKRSFSYASFVRSKNDLFKECFPDVSETKEHFMVGSKTGSSLFFMEYPSPFTFDSFHFLKELGCTCFVTFDLDRIGDKDLYLKSLEKKYSKTLSENILNDIYGISVRLSFLCDSKDALDIVGKTVKTLFFRSGYLVSDSFWSQKESFLSQISLGLIDIETHVNTRILKDIYGKEDAT